MKKHFIAVFAVIAAATLFAFTDHAASKKPVVEEKWFLFNGLPGQETDATKYTLMDPQPIDPPCSQAAAYQCAIKIEPNDSNQPDFQNNTASVTRYKQTP